MKSFIVSALSTFMLGMFVTAPASAQTVVNADFTAVPLESTRTDPPEVMLSMSRDHQYFLKAYNDYTDLDFETPVLDANGDPVLNPDGSVQTEFDVDSDGNPNIETTYKHTFDYFGYFDSEKCYTYNNNSNIFVPRTISPDKYCTGNQWSGNFLNWATMTRMDIVRAIFYGGKRSVDGRQRTVLERAYLPNDAHSFAKYYNGDDIARLTPFNNTVGNNVDPDVDNLNEGITLCSTNDPQPNGASQNVTSPPLVRVALGNYQLWGANERWQCTWAGERDNANNSNVGPSDPIRGNDFGGRFVGLDSGIDAFDSDPQEVSGREFVARVRVCVDNLIHNETCKQYPNDDPKPIGILQLYGDEGLINFGLLTGSYQNNIEGGVLRKNTGPLSDEVAVLDNGRFIFNDQTDSIIKFLDTIRPYGYNYNDGTYLGGGSQFDDCGFQLANIPNGSCNSWGNPISEIFAETLRYMAGLQPNRDFRANDDNFIDGLTTADWVDPITEDNQCTDLNTILMNASVSSFDDNNNDIQGVSGGINGTTAPPAAGISDRWTDDIGRLEGINGNDFFIGRNGTNDDETCTAKQVGSLADAIGLCPEAPTVNGSFAMAGLAYFAHNNDIRPDLAGNQTVNTFSIALATNTPVITVPRSDPNAQPIEILPAFRFLIPGGAQGGGALVDFKIVKPHSRIGRSNRFNASYYVNWEVSEQGGDYDQDVWGLIDYELDENADTIEITTTVFARSTGGSALFGFVTNGTTTDGFHAYSGVNEVDFDSPFNIGPDAVPGCDDCEALFRSTRGGSDPLNVNGRQQGPQSHTFTLSDSSSVGVLESPLFYAAKYGGFTENLDDGETISLTDAPDEESEYDVANNTPGLTGPDGLPDNFFFVTNPENLFDSLQNALNRILAQDRAASSAVASFANSNGFADIVIQGLYQELTREEDGEGGGSAGEIRQVDWTGELFSYFIDDFGLFREDNQSAGTRGQLDDYAIDRAFRYEIIEDEEPRIRFLNVTPDPVTGDVTASDVTDSQAFAELEELDTLWNAGDSLRNLNNELTRTQRPFNAVVPTGSDATAPARHIITYIDGDLDGEVDQGEQIDFDTASINGDDFRFFGVGSATAADRVIDYIRGFDNPQATGFRNRTLTLDDEEVVFRLGDVVNSTPLVIGAPNEAYDTRVGDASYTAFRTRFADRRQVAYVGANDGLLHAFNVGFRDTNSTIVEFETSLTTETAHPLGAELWAYAPFNLLPHMQFLTNPNYSHVFYVDGSPQSYDVKIFNDAAGNCPDQAATASPNDNCRYVNGWGTILVVGMRQGGGDFPLSVVDGAGNSTTTTARSAYVVLDVTDPELPPRVLAEINDDDLNLTTSRPDVIYECSGGVCSDNDPDNNFDGTWKLVFGSGPENIREFSTDDTAKLFTYELGTPAAGTPRLEVEEVQSTAGDVVEDSFVGSVSGVDWDNSEAGFRNDDVVYFGTVGTRPDTAQGATGPIETGAIYRYEIESDEFSTLIDIDRPVVQAPVLLSRGGGLPNNVLSSWVYFGTGQYLRRTDETIDEQERFYGVIEPVDFDAVVNLSAPGADPNAERSELLTLTEVDTNELLDVTEVEVLNNDDGSLDPINGVPVVTGDLRDDITVDGVTATNFAELAAVIATETQGFFRDLPQGVSTGDPTSRIVDRTVPLANQLFFTSFTPASLDREDICVGGEGISELFVVNQATGTASPFATVGIADDGTVATSTPIGAGVASAPTIFTSAAQGANSGTILIQRPDGSLTGGDDLGQTDELGNPIDNLENTRAAWREIIQ